MAAIFAGGIMPSIAIIMGSVATAFSADPDSSSGGDLISDMSTIASNVILLAASLFILSYVFYAFWQHLAENIIADLRIKYLKALMRQEIGYFEVTKVEEIPA